MIEQEIIAETDRRKMQINISDPGLQPDKICELKFHSFILIFRTAIFIGHGGIVFEKITVKSFSRVEK